MALYPEQLDDLVELTLKNETRGTWTDLSLNKQNYTFVDKFMGAKTKKKGGTSQSWKLQIANTGTARFTGLYSQDQTSVKNLSIGARQEWAIATVNFSYDVQESEFQGDNLTLIVDEIEMREHSMYNDWFELMEVALWTAPLSSAQDPRPLSGLPFWIQKNATGGFNGGNPSGFSDGAGHVNATTYANWKNYTDSYASVTRDDLVSKWRKAVTFCQFKAPHKYPTTDSGSPQWMFYTTYRLMEQLAQYMDSRNDNLKDIGGIGTGTFQGIGIDWVAALEGTGDAYDSTDPLYGIDWATFEFYFNEGREMKKGSPQVAPGQHNVRNVFMDSAGNLLCKNRRRNFVIHKP